MNIFDKFRLRRELRRGGSSDFEADELESFARKLRDMDLPALDRSTKDEIASQIGFKPVHTRQRHTMQMAGSLMAVFAVTFLAQAANPGSPLYALKRGTENVRATVQPSFKEELDDRRQFELDELKREKAAEAQIKQAEDDLKVAQDRAEEAAKNRGQSGKENKVDEPGKSDVRGRSTDDSLNSGNSNGGESKNRLDHSPNRGPRLED